MSHHAPTEEGRHDAPDANWQILRRPKAGWEASSLRQSNQRTIRAVVRVISTWIGVARLVLPQHPTCDTLQRSYSYLCRIVGYRAALIF